MIALLLLAAQPTLNWWGTGEVYPDGKPLELTVHTSIDAHNDVVSESWPTSIGPEAGVHRLKLSAARDTLEVGSKKQAAPKDLAAEERKQFAFYRQLQKAAVLARSGRRRFAVGGAVTTRFQADRAGRLVAASNLLLGEKPGTTVRQTFRFRGWWRDGRAIFPRHMEMFRDGKRYFTLDVTRFQARP